MARLTALLASLESKTSRTDNRRIRAKDAPELTKDDREIVPALRSSLAGKVGQERFDLWFGAATHLDYDGTALRVGVPNRFFLEWIRANFRQHIESACRDILGKCPSLQFHIDAAAAKTDNGSMHAATSNAGRRGCGGGISPVDVASASPAARKLASPASATRSIASSGVTLTVAAEPTAPHDGPLPRRRFASLETFVAGEANRLAIASAQMVVRRPGQVTPLMFHGPTSVGKTHLLEGIWTAARKTHRGLTTIYLSAEQFTSQFLEALRGSGLPSFRRKYRGVGMLILDDLQFMVGKRATQVELLHTIDGFIREGRQLVFAADRSPAELAELGPELITRLTGGLVCGIESPDHAARLAIVGQMAKRMKLHVPPEVQQLVASRLTTHSRQLSGALCRLQATSEALGQPITLSLAEEALTDLVSQNGRVVRLPDIEKAVCEVFGIEPASLHSDTKGKGVSHPRMLAMWLARKHTRAALSEIGHYFGRRSHSTVVSAQKRVDGWMAAGRTLDLAEHRWSTDDAIRKLERRLAAG